MVTGLACPRVNHSYRDHRRRLDLPIRPLDEGQVIPW